MANEALAPAPALPREAPSEEDYQTFCAALSASARGRAFLAEYASRHRGADTEAVLAALARLEALMRRQQGDAEALRGALRDTVGMIRAARPGIETSALPSRAAALAQLLDLLERRLAALAEAAPQPMPGDTPLAVVPAPDEPELPIPSPLPAQPALMLAHDRGSSPAVQPAPSAVHGTAIPDVSWLDAVAAEPAAAQAAASASADLPEPPKAFEPLFPEPARPKPDPLAPLMLLSEHERLALFT